MKKILVLFLTLMMVFSLFGCGKSKTERELERARESVNQLEQAYQNAKKESDDLHRMIERYEDAVAKVNGN